MTNKVQVVLTAADTVVGPLKIGDNYNGFVVLGNVDHDTIGGSALIQLTNGKEAPTTLKTITTLLEIDDIASQFTLPTGSELQVVVTGGTPDLFVKIITGPVK